MVDAKMIVRAYAMSTLTTATALLLIQRKMEKTKEKFGAAIIPDESNGPKSLNQPANCHCHCAIGPWEKVHQHPGTGGWWKNGECKRCDEMK